MSTHDDIKHDCAELATQNAKLWQRVLELEAEARHLREQIDTMLQERGGYAPPVKR